MYILYSITCTLSITCIHDHKQHIYNNKLHFNINITPPSLNVRPSMWKFKEKYCLLQKTLLIHFPRLYNKIIFFYSFYQIYHIKLLIIWSLACPHLINNQTLWSNRWLHSLPKSSFLRKNGQDFGRQVNSVNEKTLTQL